MIKLRLARLRRHLREQGLDGLLVTLPVNRRYLSDFSADDGQFGESSGALLISAYCAVLITDFRYELGARAQARYFEVLLHQKGLAAELAPLCQEHHIARLGIESEGLLVFQHDRLAQVLEGVELVSTQGLVTQGRLLKSDWEMAALERSLEIMEQVLDQVLDQDLVGKSERELALAITRAVEDAGAEGVAFTPTVASGPNGAEPHATASSRIIAAGEPVVFDVGARWEGYCSDISRTMVAGGLEKADDTFKQVYATVRAAQLAAIAGIRPGMTGAQADALAREVIHQAGYEGRFGHSLGHGVGLATHESPSVGPRSQDVLEPGMVFTVEPGIYLPDWGGVRLEVMVELTEEGCQVLGNLDRFYELG